MNRRLIQTLLIASFGALAMSATADNATPREKPTTESAANATEQGTPLGTATAPGAPMARGSRAMTSDEIRAYKDARQACDHLAAGQQEQCRAQANARFANVDPKCQKLSGASLDDCLKGADRAAQ